MNFLFVYSASWWMLSPYVTQQSRNLDLKILTLAWEVAQSVQCLHTSVRTWAQASEPLFKMGTDRTCDTLGVQRLMTLGCQTSLLGLSQCRLKIGSIAPGQWQLRLTSDLCVGNARSLLCPNPPHPRIQILTFYTSLANSLPSIVNKTKSILKN